MKCFARSHTRSMLCVFLKILAASASAPLCNFAVSPSSSILGKRKHRIAFASSRLVKVFLVPMGRGWGGSPGSISAMVRFKCSECSNNRKKGNENSVFGYVSPFDTFDIIHGCSSFLTYVLLVPGHFGNDRFELRSGPDQMRMNSRTEE